MKQIIDEWDDLVEFLPQEWLELAKKTNALKGLRKDKSPSDLLRSMFLHFACGCSLRETVLRGREKGFFHGSDVALMGRIIKSGEWLRQLCERLIAERGMSLQKADCRLRMLDASDVKEPGATGSSWRIHMSMTLPELQCDHFSIGPTTGKGAGESFRHFHIAPGDLLVADRGYSRTGDIAYAQSAGAFVCVRVNYSTLPLFDMNKRPFALVEHLKKLKTEGSSAEWNVQLFDPSQKLYVAGRLCAIKKGNDFIEQSHKRSRDHARRNGTKIKDKTLFVNEHVIIFTTFDPDKFPLRRILKIYRLRWQIELLFKRFKSLANLGHLPKQCEKSAKAWLYGKLLVALLTEKIIAAGGALSPWRDASDRDEEPVEGIRFYLANSPADNPPKDSPFSHSIALG